MKKKWILFAGIIALIIYVALYQIIGYHKNSRYSSVFNISYKLYIISALVAPIFEEIVFRGIFTPLSKRIKFYWCSFILVPALVLFFSYGATFLIPFFISLLFYRFLIIKDLIKSNNVFIIILSALVFSLAHYSLIDLASFKSYYTMVLHFSLGLILTWITINYGLKKSIIAHFFYNLLICLYLSIPLFLVDTRNHKVGIDNTYISWKEKPMKIITESSIINNQNGASIKSSNIIQIDKYLLDGEIEKNHELKVSPFLLFDLEINANNNSELKEKTIKLLIKANFIK